MTRFIFLTLLSAIALITTCLFQGCETAQKSPSPNGRRQSAIPWNRPEKWEGPGIMGNNMPGAGY